MPPFKLNPPPASLPPGSQILAYLRDSGHETQELSTQQQQNSLAEWAASHGLIITQFYIDEMRGSTTNRDQLQLLMNTLRHGVPEKAVIVWSYNRFSRGLDDPVLYRAEVRTLGYLFHSLTDDVPEGPIGRIVEAVIDYKNYQYLVDLSIDIRRGQRDLVQIHGCIPGTPPRGFKRVPVTLGHRRDGSAHIAHRWDPDPETAPLVLQAFTMRAAGASLLAINNATHLYSGISSYATFWSNKLYIGTLQFADLIIENYCSPIIPLVLWNEVQEVQARYQAVQHTKSDQIHPRRTSSRYILSGILRCAQCGGPINGSTSTYRGHPATDTYACTGLRKHTCTTRRIPRQLLEQTIINTVSGYILEPEIAHARQQLDAQTQFVQIAQLEQQRAFYNTRLVKNRAKQKRLSKAISAHGHGGALLSELTELEQQEIVLLSKLAQVNRVASPQAQYTVDQHALIAQRTIAILQNGTLDQKRLVLRDIIFSIKVQNVDKTLKGIVFFYSPALDPAHISENDHAPPVNAVSLPHFPPGAQKLKTSQKPFNCEEFLAGLRFEPKRRLEQIRIDILNRCSIIVLSG